KVRMKARSSRSETRRSRSMARSTASWTNPRARSRSKTSCSVLGPRSKIRSAASLAASSEIARSGRSGIASDPDPALSSGFRGRRGGLVPILGGPREAERLAQLPFELHRRVRVLLQPEPGVLPSLSDPLFAIGEPGPALLDHVPIDRQVEKLPLPGDSLVEEDVELGLLEGSRDLVLHHLHLHAAADVVVAFLDRADASNVQPDRRVELERAPAGRR